MPINPMAGKIHRQNVRKTIESSHNMSFNIEKINRNINDLDNGVVDPNQSYQAQAQEFTELISSLKNDC